MTSSRSLVGPGLNENVSPDKILESFTSRLKGKQGWTRSKPAKIPEGTLEVSSDEQVPAWRGSIDISGVNPQDLIIICKHLLGEDMYIHSSSCRNSFMTRFDLGNDAPLLMTPDALKRKSIVLSPSTAAAAAAAMVKSTIGGSPPASPSGSSSTSSPVMGSILSGFEKQKSSRELATASAQMGGSGRKLSQSPSSQRGAWRSQTDLTASEDEDANTSDGDDKNTITTDGEDKSVTGERLSLTRRISRLATSGMRRVSAIRASGTQAGNTSGITTSKDRDPEFPRSRKLRFIRYEFPSNIVCVDDDTIFEPLPDDDVESTRRMKLNVMGASVVALSETTVRLTYLVDIDPLVEQWESPIMTGDMISEMCGKDHVETFLITVRDICQSLNKEDSLGVNNKEEGLTDSLWEMLRLRNDWTGDGIYGRIRWGAYSGRDSLIVGSQIRHIQHGSGNIESFDMRGTFKVKYDNAPDSVNHQVEEREKLRLTLNVGNRVRHRSKGLGVVQCTMFEEVCIRFDSGQLRKYPKDGWQKKLKRVTDEEDSLLKFSCAPHVEIREGVARVQFVVPDCHPETILRHILHKGDHIAAEEKAEVLERRILKTVDENTRILWEQRAMPKPLTPRTFVSREHLGRVSQAIIVNITHTVDNQVPEQPGMVRGHKVCDGWVIEPIPLLQSCSVTHVLCLDLAGFVPPEALRSVRDSVLTSEALNLIHECRVLSSGGGRNSISSPSLPLPASHHQLSQTSTE